MSDISKALTSYTYFRQLLEDDPNLLNEVVECFLKNIESNKHLNAFVRVYDHEVRKQAAIITDKLKTKRAGKLAGLVVGIKDMFSYKNHPVQAASKILEGYIAQANATVIERLLAEDALIIGHQNCDEFGMGSSTQHSVYGPTYNALDTSRVAGGSSGGSAASLQARLCHVSLGTDTGGSVRQPAAYCGLLGLKPTYSLIPRDHVIAYASSLDTIGILSHNTPDAAAVLGVIAGESKYDNTSSRESVPNYSKNLTWKGKAKVAYPVSTLEAPSLQVAIKKQAYSLLDSLRGLGHYVESVDFPFLNEALATYYVLSTAEASANLARYDGVRYGYRAEDSRSLQEVYQKTRTGAFGQEVKKRILLGTFVLGQSYYDAYYLKAQKVRRLIKESIHHILTKFDFILLPTTPTTAFHPDSKQHANQEYLADLYTVIASLAGLPTISLPYGKDEKGMPIGMQFIAKSFDEARLLAFSDYFMNNVR